MQDKKVPNRTNVPRDPIDPLNGFMTPKHPNYSPGRPYSGQHWCLGPGALDQNFHWWDLAPTHPMMVSCVPKYTNYPLKVIPGVPQGVAPPNRHVNAKF